APRLRWTRTSKAPGLSRQRNDASSGPDPPRVPEQRHDRPRSKVCWTPGEPASGGSVLQRASPSRLASTSQKVALAKLNSVGKGTLSQTAFWSTLEVTANSTGFASIDTPLGLPPKSVLR